MVDISITSSDECSSSSEVDDEDEDFVVLKTSKFKSAAASAATDDADLNLDNNNIDTVLSSNSSISNTSSGCPRLSMLRSTSNWRSIYNTTNQSFRILRRQSSSLLESLHYNYSNLLPATPTGWALGALSLCSVGLQYELRLQKELTAPPIVFCQISQSGGVLNGRMERIYNKLTDNIKDEYRSKYKTKTPSLSNDTYNSTTTSSRRQRQRSRSFNRNRSINSASEITIQSRFKQHKIPTSKQASKQGMSTFSRTVTPSLFIGTRGIVASTAAYALGSKQCDANVKRVREVMKMGADGALIVLDWELPLDSPTTSNNSDSTAQQSSMDNNIDNMDITKPNSITKPIILLLHGMNNDSTFGYIRSMMRTATDRGWIACCMNLRGQDGLHQVKNSTPRGYNAGYTGDLRGVVEQLEYRLKKRGGTSSTNLRKGKNHSKENKDDDDEDDYIGGPIYILGYSLGANIVTKYLGEESLHGTLPKCIGGGAAMGNPLHIHSGCIAFPWNMLLGAGVKRSILQNASTLRQHHEPGFQHAMKKALLAPTIGKLDDAAAPYLVRNDSHPPYSTRIGFKDGEEYWWESSSHRYVGHVSVPLLKISAQDDFLVFGQFQKKLNHCLENPNVVVVKTRCGGHLGWQESPPPGSRSGGDKGGLLGGSGSWSDVAVADFIEALLQIREEDREKRLRLRRGSVNDVDGGDGMDNSITRPKIMSRL